MFATRSLPTALAMLGLVACGSDGGSADPDARGADAAPLDPDADPGSAQPLMTPLSTTGSDQFFAVAFAPDGKFYATGYSADGFEPTADRSLALARFLPDGALDPSFGRGGVTRLNVAVGGHNNELARSLVVQSTGKIVIGGTVEHDALAGEILVNDRDLVLVRFDDTGAIDESFGDDGVKIIDLSTGAISEGAMTAADNLWSVARGADDALVVHGNQRSPLGDGLHLDTDWAMLRLTADGELDGSFADDGVFTLDIGEVNGSARGAVVLEDGGVLASGYAKLPGETAVEPFLYKLTAEGELDDGFGTGGVFHQVVLSAVTEIYGFALVGGSVVTTGYGKELADAPNDVVSLRITAAGELDPTWGEGGATVVDVAALNDQSRAIVALPDGRVLLVGAGTPTVDSTDAMVVVLGADGAPDTTFAPDGRRLFDLGGPTDHFWGAAVSPSGDRVVVVGLRGAGMAASATSNDDAAIYVLPLE